MQMNGKPLVSIIIPTFNSGKKLAQCLGSVAHQTYLKIAIVIIDRFSEDETARIAKRHDATLFFLDAERARAKNFGIAQSTGSYTLFIDADMELTERVVEECVTLAERNPEIGGLVIPERSVGTSFWVTVRDFERSFYVGTELESARFFRRDVLDKVGGFDENVVFFEESTLPQKIEKVGYTSTTRINAEILHHEDDFSLLNWLKKKYYYGKTAQKYRHKYTEYGKRQMSMVYRFRLFFKSKRFYSKPLLAIGIVVLKSLEYCSAGFAYFVTKIINE